MKLLSLLTILQEAEYDPRVFSQWLQHERDEETIAYLQTIRPEKWTLKLRILFQLSRLFAFLLPTEKAVLASVRVWQPVDWCARQIFVTLAIWKLRLLAKRGLRVVAVAGSYGKTSTKHAIFHTLSQHHFTLMTPASVNTPLGIAQIILKKLTTKHEIFLVEFGEYYPGDILELMEFVRPHAVVVTPIGYAHLERFGSVAKLNKTFLEVWSHRVRPEILIVSDKNRDIFPSNIAALWYGKRDNSHAKLKQISPTLEKTTGSLQIGEMSYPFESSLVGAHQSENMLPGLLLAQEFGFSVKDAITALAYQPPTSRRMEVSRHNGITLVDNSYNTNPGSWKEIQPLLAHLTPRPLAIVTGGFVELDDTTTKHEHKRLIKDLIESAQIVGIIRTRNNEDIISELTKHAPITLVIGWTLDEILQEFQSRRLSYKTLWLEGGSRALYQ